MVVNDVPMLAANIFPIFFLCAQQNNKMDTGTKQLGEFHDEIFIFGWNGFSFLCPLKLFTFTFLYPKWLTKKTK